MVGGLTEEDCDLVMEHVIGEVADDESEDRLRCLTDSIHALQFGRKVTGYTMLAEMIGNEWKAALLRLRGGGDPDALATLFDTGVRIHNGLTKPNCYVDLAGGADDYAELDRARALPLQGAARVPPGGERQGRGRRRHRDRHPLTA